MVYNRFTNRTWSIPNNLDLTRLKVLFLYYIINFYLEDCKNINVVMVDNCRPEATVKEEIKKLLEWKEE